MSASRFTLTATMWGTSQRFHFTDEKTHAQLREGQWLEVVLSALMTFLLLLQVTENSKVGGMGQVAYTLEAGELGIWNLGSSYTPSKGAAPTWPPPFLPILHARILAQDDRPLGAL